MKVLVVVDDHFKISEVPGSQRKAPDEARIRVETISLNRGRDHRGVGRGQAVGGMPSLPSWMKVLMVRGLPSAHGSSRGDSPVRGRSNESTTLAPVPEIKIIKAATATALPVAGLTALHAVKAAGAADGVRVAVSGATGGVGHLATQLAADAEASVIAVTREPRRTALLPAVFSTPNVEMVASDQIPAQDEINAVIDTVGGTMLTGLMEKARRSRRRNYDRCCCPRKGEFEHQLANRKKIGLTSVEIPTPVGADLGRVVELVATGRINLQITEAGAGRVLRLTRLRRFSDPEKRFSG